MESTPALGCCELLPACWLAHFLHTQEEALPSCWEELHQSDEVAADQNFDNFVRADADTTEVLGDEEIVQLVSNAQEESEDA